MDQSIVFDGGWRILQGQVPYRDFLIPFGPVSMWIQALAFHLFDVSYRTYVLTACWENMLGAGLAFATVRMLVPEKSWAAWTAGWITGSWLYAPMGTTYLEQTAFVFLWIALAAVVKGTLSPAPTRRAGWMVGAGLAMAAALLSKTNAGGLGIPFLFLTAFFLPPARQRRCWADGVALGLGLVAGLGLFAAWLIFFSDATAFREIVLGAGGHEGQKRLLHNKGLGEVFASLLVGKGNDLIRILTVTAYTLMGLGLLRIRGSIPTSTAAETARRTASIGLLWVTYQQCFGITSNNNGINEQPFLGLVLVCAFVVAGTFPQLTGTGQENRNSKVQAVGFLGGWALLFSVLVYAMGNRGLGNFGLAIGTIVALGIFLSLTASPRIAEPGLRLLRWMGAGIAVTAFSIGTWGSYFRQAQDFFNFQTRYVRGEGIPSLRGLAWADGVNADAVAKHPTWSEFVEIWKLLNKSPGRFHLLGDYTILYALTGRPNVGPVSYFYRGLTLPEPYDAVFDAKFASRVDQSDMAYFVLENPAENNPLLDSLPKLRSVLTDHYRFDRRVGIFHVFRRIGQPDKPSE